MWWILKLRKVRLGHLPFFIFSIPLVDILLVSTLYQYNVYLMFIAFHQLYSRSITSHPSLLSHCSLLIIHYYPNISFLIFSILYHICTLLPSPLSHSFARPTRTMKETRSSSSPLFHRLRSHSTLSHA